MAWVIIVLGALLVIAPVIWIMPTPQQRRHERLRAEARRAGLDVVASELPQTRRARARREATRRIMLYRSTWSPERIPWPCSAWWLRLPEGGWEEGSEPVSGPVAEAVDQLLARLPASVLGVGIGPQGPGLYWTEREDDLARVHEFAAALASIRAVMESEAVHHAATAR